MFFVEVFTACIPGYAAAAIYARHKWARIKYSRCLASIRLLEADLGMGGATARTRGPQDASRAWKEAASAKAANYSAGTLQSHIDRSTAWLSYMQAMKGQL